MKLILAIVCLLLIENCKGQDRDTLHLICNSPLRNGFLVKISDADYGKYLNPDDGVIISKPKDSSDSVFSLTSGEVIKVAYRTDGYVAVIKDNNLYISYSSLSSCTLKIGMKIGQGTYLGIMSNAPTQSGLQVIISNGKRIWSTEEHMKFLRCRG